MIIDVISLMPEMFSALNYGITGRAIQNQLLTLNLNNPRDFTRDKHRTVDDTPYGGGPGMLMKYQPLKDCLDDIYNHKSIAQAKEERTSRNNSKVIYLSPQGKRLQQSDLKKLTGWEHLVLICGRYEGIDERLIQQEVDEEYSIGDYVLSGGELAAMILIDGMTRLLPGAVGDNESVVNDSFYDNLLDYPHYTRPAEVDGHKVPEVLLSGNHEKINQWRQEQSLLRTLQRRPDLLDDKNLSHEQLEIIARLKNE
ncbi:MAG: tRNA (guanosine(37)-N1)-methyltransferase TrmD [Gammaproteobacteria bacterium]|nr:tRNA (guanosine(37)-N1)-methyltransferase TrmD [Gammaproteobacteria bacterium]